MEIGLIIKQLAKERGIPVNELAEYLGKSEQATYDIFKKRDVSTAILRKCAELFDVPVSYFFQEGNVQAVAKDHSIAAVNSTLSTDTLLQIKEKLELLEALVQEKERTIQILMNK